MRDETRRSLTLRVIRIRHRKRTRIADIVIVHVLVTGDADRVLTVDDLRLGLRLRGGGEDDGGRDEGGETEHVVRRWRKTVKMTGSMYGGLQMCCMVAVRNGVVKRVCALRYLGRSEGECKNAEGLCTGRLRDWTRCSTGNVSRNLLFMNLYMTCISLLSLVSSSIC